MSRLLAAPDPWMMAWPALPALLMLLVGAWGLRRELRPDRWTWAVLALALVVRVVVMPLERLEFDGHEAEYRDILVGARPVSRGGTLLYPAMQWLYRGLGAVWPEPKLMTALSVAMGLLSVAALVGCLGRLVDRRVGLWAGVALALWGNHAFWSSSGYNVILPHAIGVTAMWGLAVLGRGGAPLPAGLLAGGAAALAVSTRVELALLAPLGVVWLLAMRPGRPGRWLPPLVLGAALGGLSMWLVMGTGQTPGAEQRALSWSINHSLLAYFAPFDAPWLWPGLLLGAGLSLRRAPAVTLSLLALVVGSHLTFATFEDYGFRHLLSAEWALSVAIGGLALSRWGWPFLFACGLGLAAHTADVAQRFYASEESFAAWAEASLPDAAPMSADGLPSCSLICEDFRVVAEEEQRSHFNLLDPREAEALREEGGCILWLMGVQDYRWSSRSVRARALRVERIFEVTPRAVVKENERGYVGVVVGLGPRREPRLTDAL